MDWRKLRKIILKTLKWAGLSMLGLIVLVFAINLVDESLDPEVPAFSKYRGEPVPAKGNAYFYMLGIDAPATMDPHTAGQRKVEASETMLEQKNQLRPVKIEEEVYGGPPIRTNGSFPLTCDWVKEPCIQKYLGHRKEINQYLKANALQLKRAKHILDYPHYDEVMTPNMDMEFPAFLNLMSRGLIAEAIFQAHAGRMDEALTGLARQIRFQHMLLEHSSSLISKIVAAAYLEHRLFLLAEMLTAYPITPEQNRRIHYLARSLSPAELSLEWPIHHEFASLNSLFRRIGPEGYPYLFTMDNPGFGQKKSAWLQSYFLKPNATINMEFRTFKVAGQIATMSSPELLEHASKLVGKDRKTDEPSLCFYLSLPYNPVGKTFSLISQNQWDVTAISYAGRMHTLEATARLVRVLVHLKRDGAGPKQVPPYLARLNDKLKNPYTGKVPEWNPETRELSFPVLVRRADKIRDGSMKPLDRRVTVRL